MNNIRVLYDTQHQAFIRCGVYIKPSLFSVMSRKPETSQRFCPKPLPISNINEFGNGGGKISIKALIKNYGVRYFAGSVKSDEEIKELANYVHKRGISIT